MLHFNCKKTKKITYRAYNTYNHPIPCIMIEGDFLTNLGFLLGETVAVEYLPKKIIIRKL